MIKELILTIHPLFLKQKPKLMYKEKSFGRFRKIQFLKGTKRLKFTKV